MKYQNRIKVYVIQLDIYYYNKRAGWGPLREATFFESEDAAKRLIDFRTMVGSAYCHWKQARVLPVEIKVEEKEDDSTK